MRGYPQAASARLRAAMLGRRWSAWITQTIQRRRRISLERVEVIERLERELREARRSGEYRPDFRRTW